MHARDHVTVGSSSYRQTACPGSLFSSPAVWEQVMPVAASEVVCGEWLSHMRESSHFGASLFEHFANTTGSLESMQITHTKHKDPRSQYKEIKVHILV